MSEPNRSYTGDKGQSSKQSSYKILQCIMVNSDGDEKDIRNMVGYIRIHESIFSAALMCEIGIRDESNFLEEFNITGNELINLEIEINVLGVKRELNYTFYVREYNDYARSAQNNQIQAYTLIAVSEHAYIAPLINYSGTAFGTTTSVLENIFKNELDTTGEDHKAAFITEGNCKTEYVGSHNLSNPLKESLKVLSTAADVNNTPYVLYQDLSTNINLVPLSYVTDREENPIYKTFVNKQLLSTDDGDNEYLERSTQMLNITSNIGMAPSIRTADGGVATNNTFIDISNKQIRRNAFFADIAINKDFTTAKALPSTTYGVPTLQRVQTELRAKAKKNVTSAALNLIHPLIGLANGLFSKEVPSSDQYKFGQTRAPAAKDEYRYINSNNVEATTPSQTREQHSNTSRAYLSNYDSCSHKFTVMGDTLLNPARTIQLKFPKATDPSVYKKYTGKSETNLYDHLLSGPYLIFETTHTFQEGKYETQMTVKTDALVPTGLETE